MKKILIISTRNFFPPHGGDKIRIYKIAKLLSKKNLIDIICLSDQQNAQKENFVNKQFLFKTNNFFKIIYSFLQLLKFEPMQTGFFFSKKMKEKIESIKSNYDIIICHLSRSSIYLPKNFEGYKILEMTDIVSENYLQRSIQESYFNPSKYLYWIESKLLKKFEKDNLNKFDNIVLVNNPKNFLLKKNKKIKVIPNGIEKISSKFSYSKKNKYIIFYGNINSHINKKACLDFVNKILPKLNKYTLIKLKIVGKIDTKLKKKFSMYANVEVTGSVKSLDLSIKDAICGICNVDSATGFQNKIFEYMRLGLPTIISKQSFNNLFKKNKNVIVYNSNDDLIAKILKIKFNKKISNKLGIEGMKLANKNTWKKNLKNYSSLI